MENLTDSQWEVFISTKINNVKLSIDSEQTSAPLASIISPSDPRFAQAIDHTLLKQDATQAQIDKLCDEAIKYGFKSCCVNGLYIPQVAQRLKRSPSIPCCVVGFPLGAGSAEAKAFEARDAVQAGAQEIDVVQPIGLLLSNPPQYHQLFNHLKKVIDAVHPIPVKVILETGLIPTFELKIAASVIAAEAGAAFIKTSTGFASGTGATKEDVDLMYRSVQYVANVKVKASGGVRTFEQCQNMFTAGAERIGTSSGVSLMGLSAAIGGSY